MSGLELSPYLSLSGVLPLQCAAGSLGSLSAAAPMGANGHGTSPALEVTATDDGGSSSVPPANGAETSKVSLCQKLWFRVLSAKRPVGVLPAPNLAAAPVSYLKPREVFEVESIVTDQQDQRRYLRLPSLRGWVPELSRKDADRLAVEQVTAEQALQEAPPSKPKPTKEDHASLFVPRQRRRRVQGGPAKGAVVWASFKRKSAASRGFVLQASFKLPDGQSFQGPGSKKRVQEAAPSLALRLFNVYRKLQEEMLVQWDRHNVFSERRGIWRRRSTPKAMPAPGTKVAVRRRASRTGANQAAGAENVQDQALLAICDAEFMPAGSGEELLAICDGQLALENGRPQEEADESRAMKALAGHVSAEAGQDQVVPMDREAEPGATRQADQVPMDDETEPAATRQVDQVVPMEDEAEPGATRQADVSSRHEQLAAAASFVPIAESNTPPRVRRSFAKTKKKSSMKQALPRRIQKDGAKKLSVEKQGSIQRAREWLKQLGCSPPKQ
eukprot:TRINITY_DN3139_c0_g1_i1.p1 TRINITY_DN3139_c0_g1~~TRINITY_DN3139_c0_g1_i1.p1  ORF type:complete len:500 (+),score=110.22 TRINITY_DN3139_c0_g1_i1:96-1595(+)